jgi:CBS domain-containing protein
MLVSEILRVKGNSALFTATPGSPARDAVKVMAQHDVGSLIVMEHGHMSGLMTFREILAALAERGGTLGDLTVSDLMVKDPLTTDPHMDVSELRRIMLQAHARYVPVMDGMTLMGVVSFHDVAKAVYEEQSFENRMLRGYIKNWPEEEAPAA